MNFGIIKKQRPGSLVGLHTTINLQRTIFSNIVVEIRNKKKERDQAKCTGTINLPMSHTSHQGVQLGEYAIVVHGWPNRPILYGLEGLFLALID